MGHPGFLFSLALICASGTPSAVVPAVPTAIEHAPPPGARRGEPLSLLVTLAGGGGPPPAVTVRFRPQGAPEYQSLTLKEKGRGAFAGAIPAGAARGFQVSYYVSVIGPRNAYRLNLGSADAPFTVTLADPPVAAKTSRGNGLLFVAAGLAAAGAGGLGLRRYHRRAVADRRFWVRTLFPISHLTGPRLEQQLRELASTPLDHPTEGLRTFPESLLGRKLERIRQVDVETLVRQGR